MMKNAHMICRTCGLPIRKNTRRSPPAPTYIHDSIFIDLETWDREISNNPHTAQSYLIKGYKMISCDFCTEQIETALRFTADPLNALIMVPGRGYVPVQLDPHWNACEACAKLVLAGDQAALEERAISYFIKNYDGVRSSISRYIHILYTHFFRTANIPSRN